MKALLALASELNIKFIKIKAHQKPTNKENYNIEVDKLSRQMVRDAVNKASKA